MDTPTGRILVVDDDEVIRKILKSFLESDYEVVCADNSIEGLRLAQFEPFDLILLDVQMPIFDGQDLSESLKENPATREIPIIFITALTSTEDQVKCFQAGASDFVSKPLIEEIVQARVKVHFELKQQRDYLHKLTTIDPLTGIANRQFFEKNLDREWRRCQRESQPLSMLAIDIDFFKRYNEHYGCSTGVECLVKITDLMNTILNRGGDFFARVSGDEFIALLPNTPIESLDLLAEKFRLTVESANVPHERSPISKNVTVSVGGATLVPDRQLKPSDLYALVEKQLDTAKAQGQNRYSLATQPSK